MHSACDRVGPPLVACSLRSKMAATSQESTWLPALCVPRWVVCQVGLEADRYNGHSFRIGASTSTAQARVEDSFIKMLGCCESAANQCYIRNPRNQLPAISLVLKGS